ncbi:MAG: aspartate--tRNA ligase [Planctomycetes bacterium]|nr:aspartate--tRNA ligase [Planctomycetota bacterium]MBI3846779.1 aspartate--tRNA ligase [Planctomycetota bacterium]
MSGEALRRTHTCGELRRSDIRKEVVLSGWVRSTRDHGGLIFIDLRDRYGVTQVVANPEPDTEIHRIAEKLRPEDVVTIRGEVNERPSGTRNTSMPTGEVEVVARGIVVENRAKTPPFEIADDVNVSEETRLRYRYLDLRRPAVQRSLIFRSDLCNQIRRYFSERSFIEVETPFLTKSTPEGARDFLVPSRITKGSFYALPQSPQLFKQLLMVSGFDRYYQIVRCFRDEDLRADRQPEFTQLDIEMSFVDEPDVQGIIEGLLVRLGDTLLGRKIQTPFPRLRYDDVMLKYGSDRPDLRFGLEIRDVTEIAREVDFKIFRGAAEGGGAVRALNLSGGGALPRQQIDALEKVAKDAGAGGLAWFKVQDGALTAGPAAKFIAASAQARFIEALEGKTNDLLLFVADKKRSVVAKALGELRMHLARTRGMIPNDVFHFSWIVDFPLLNWNEEEKRYEAEHHPFTSPKPADVPKLESDPLAVRARAYDLVLNGIELGGGSIRIHTRELQQRVFSLLQIDEQAAMRKFGFLLEALEFGAPPHGGIALGLDRMVMLFQGLQSLREVIAFPKTSSGSCLLTEAPSVVEARQLQEVGIRVL